MEWDPLELSFVVAITSTAITLVVGLALATLLATRRLPGRELLDAIITGPLVLPPTVLGYYVLVALGRRSAIGRAFEDLTGTSIVFTFTGCVVAATIGALPLMVKSARAALEGVDPTLVRAARTLGAGPVRAYFTVMVPLAWRGILAGVMLGFAKALGDFGVTLMIAGDIPGETQTASLKIYDLINANHEAEAAGMIALFTAIAVATLWTVNHITRRRDDD